MKIKLKTNSILLLLLGVVPVAVYAGHASTNRISVSTRAGFNIKAGFNYNVSSAPGVPRTTPDGDLYNYDDGYVLEDVSGNVGGQTWYWGYDTAAQDSGSEILLNRSTDIGGSGESEMDGDTAFFGAEIVFSQELDRSENWRFGFDFAANFMPLKFEDNSPFFSNISTTTDAYSYTTGATPPGAPYEGTFNGPGFIIDATPSSSSTVVAPGAIVNVHSELDGILWGARIGPYMEFPIGNALALHLSGGFSLGLLDVDVSWNTTSGAPENGGGSDLSVLPGAYLGADLVWRVAENWSLSAGAEFEYLNGWEKDYGQGTVSLDLTQSLYATLGIMYDF